MLFAAAPDKLATPSVEFSALLPVLILLGGALLLMVVGAVLPRRSRAPWHPVVSLVLGVAALANPAWAWAWRHSTLGRLQGLLVVTGVVLVVLAAVFRRADRFAWHAPFAMLVAVASIASAVPLWFRARDDGPLRVVADAVRVDGLTVFLAVVIGVGVILTCLLADDYLRRERLEGPDAYVLLLLSASGGVIMAAANDLMVIFLGLEILSIAVYVLAGIHVRRARSGEAALKYFVLGAFSSAFLLYGIALVYGATGTTNLTGIRSFLATNILTNDVTLLAGFGLLLVGLGFKVAAAPFHAWTPDVYDGSPSPVVAYMASGVKTAGFAAILRVFVYGFSSYQADWKPIVYVVAVFTLLVGSVFAVSQRNVKRMLAYSSISHAGFILVGVQAASEQGTRSVLFYLATYTFTVAGSFGIATVVGRTGDNAHDLRDYQGLAKRAPLLAFAFLVFLLAQAGVPFTSGFLAKFYVIGAAVEARSFWLGLVAMLSSVISAFVYLRIVVTMYGDDPEEGAPTYRVPTGARIALIASVLATIGLGIVPGPLWDATRTAVVGTAPPAQAPEPAPTAAGG
ncbi:MAG: proton-translocating NADH-quinone oxidoreductase, chain [Acidimicrobiales bacterium]|nr:proton-translocating NADH-quinone oxidoreductase, chain [Acidimicrobiales bacterium]